MNKANIEWIERGYIDMHVSELRKSLGSLVGPSQRGYVLQKDELRKNFGDIIAHNRNRPFQRAYLQKITASEKEKTSLRIAKYALIARST
jgi:hypothetical protein